MKLRFLGTGTAWSKAPSNYNNNLLVEPEGGGQSWLVDCGTTAPQALYDIGLGPADFKGVLVTHMHGDHVFGLEEVGFYNYFVRRRRVMLWLPTQLLSSVSGIEGEDLWENCLRGPMGTVQMVDGSAKEVGLSDYFEIAFLEPGQQYDIEGVNVEIFAVEHVPRKPCFGLILNGCVAFTSDCQYSRARVEWLLERGCQRIYHDVYFGPAFPGRVHTAFEEMRDLPREVAERIVLMHYNDDVTHEQVTEAEDAGFSLATRGRVYSCPTKRP